MLFNVYVLVLNTNKKKPRLIIFSVLEHKSECVSLKKTIDPNKGLNKIDEENENDDFAGF